MSKILSLFAAFVGLASVQVFAAPRFSNLTGRALPIYELGYEDWPQSSENICYSWYCNNGPRSVTVDRASADAHRAANSCGKSSSNRCSTKQGHASGYQCDEWPWALARMRQLGASLQPTTADPAQLGEISSITKAPRLRVAFSKIMLILLKFAWLTYHSRRRTLG
ncbi:hypothetical protein HGRIS_005690 [Hohenbuehelia grisea]|uniref:Deoxyribonuclease NucA/NucB domain-containing protein n=1 Tax=Hohenbuehelia grisea TaxID=104357 RepID=A0ABR3JZ24_9AGAR